MKPTPLTTPDEVIDALGGTTEAAKKCGKSPQAISNWRSRGIPPEMFVTVNALLTGGKHATPEAFVGMSKPSEAA